MFIKQFEIFHGIALTKLLRSEKPVSVRLIETKPTEDWQVYAINDVDLFIKHRAISKPLARKKGGHSWRFIFSPTEVSRINKKARPVYVALICGQPYIQDEMEICFLYPEQVEETISLDGNKSASVTVRSEPSKSLRVIVHRKEKLTVSRNAIEKWEILGS